MNRFSVLRKAIDWKGHGLRDNLSLISDLLAILAAATTFFTFIALKASDAAVVYALFYWSICIPLPAALALLLVYPFTEVQGPGKSTVPSKTSIFWARVIWGLLALELLAIFGFLAYEFFNNAGGS